MADAQRGKVGNYRLRLIESKVAIELQAIGRARKFGFHFHHSRSQATDHASSVPRLSVFSLTPSLAKISLEAGGTIPPRESALRFARRSSFAPSGKSQCALSPRSSITSYRAWMAH